jgi:3-oxoacyl-[acyl-carrier-protein] synthase II
MASKFTDQFGRPIVAVTGIGIVTSLGQGKTDNWAALTSGKSGIHTITRFPTDLLNTRIAGTVDFLPESGKGASVLSLALASAAAEEAIAEAGFAGPFGGPLFLAAPPVELEWQHRFALEKELAAVGDAGYDRMLQACRAARHDSIFDAVQFGAIADQLQERFGTRGLPITLSTACASGATAIQLGVEAIRRGEATRVLSIGTDGSVSAESLVRFSLLSALSTHNDPAEKAAKPFSKDRDGFVMAEGSAALGDGIAGKCNCARRESDRHPARAAAKRPTISTALVPSPTARLPSARFARRWPMPALFQKMQSATSTRMAPRRLKTTRWSILPFRRSSASACQHSRLVQQVDDRPHADRCRCCRSCIFASDHAGRHHSPDHQLRHTRSGHPLDTVPNVARKADVSMVLSNSFGFGGQNSCLVMAREPN